MSQMSFEIKKVGSNEKITSIEAGSFKAAISEFAKSYDINEIDKYEAISDKNKLQFRYIFTNTSPQKDSLSESEEDIFDIYRKNMSDKIYAVLSNSKE